tara:strand:+ start:1648 stop:1911 length:264 start_codon:yes stop_codon:yes gene_type:complete
MKTKLFILSVLSLLCFNCKKIEETKKVETTNTAENYLKPNTEDQFLGGIKMIPITTPKGEFKVWTKRVGNNPTMKVLLLHGGPGMTH